MTSPFSFKLPVRSGSFRVLTVCTGNICRSPFAEQYLRSSLAASGVNPVEIESAGTMAQDGQAMPEQAIELVRRYGANPDGHEARYLVEGYVASADLVLGMGREHRRSVVAMLPRASRFTFTLREFARLSNGITSEDLVDSASLSLSDVAGRLRAAVAVVAARRGYVEAVSDPLEDDVVDPYRLDDSVFAESGRQLVPAVDSVVRLLQLATDVTVGSGVTK